MYFNKKSEVRGQKSDFRNQKSEVRSQNMRSFQNLDIWKRSHALAIEIYKVTRTFPSNEAFGQVSQIRRAVVSIPTNIAEGCGRRTNSEFANFLNIASGSASEVEYEIILAKETNYINEQQYKYLINEIRQIRSMISAYMTRLHDTKADI